MTKRPFRFGIINERSHAADAWTRRAQQAEALGYSTFLIREGAGERFDAIELSTIVGVTLSDAPRAAAQAQIDRRGWSGVPVDDVLAMPTLAIGTIDGIAETLEARRERFGLSYYVVSDAAIETFAPVVARLRGR